MTPSSSISPEAGAAATLSFGTFKLGADGTLLRGNNPVHLAPKELLALRVLLDHAGGIVTAQELRKALWGDVHVTADSVPRCISSLRDRLDPDDVIQTVYKRGYRFAAEVQQHRSVQVPNLPRLAILPFAVGPNVASHLGQSIAEEAAVRLTRRSTPIVSVLARDSVFTLANQGLTAHQVGEALKADLVLTGTLLAMPSHFRLRAEMVRVKDGTQIWVEDMMVEADRVEGLESELVERLAFRLGVASSIESDAPVESANSPIQRDAYENFRRGHHEWQTLERHRMQDGMQHLLRATELDPTLISAQIDLVNACLTQNFYGFMSAGVASEHVRRIAAAIPDLAENAPAILPAVGWIRLQVDHDLASALHLFALCSHLPHNPWTTKLRVMLALSRHRFGEACGLLRAALVEDPFAPWLHAQLGWAYHLAGESAKSVEQIGRSLALFPDHELTNLYGATILAFNGQASRGSELARDLAQRLPYFDAATAVHAYVLACEGDHASARTMMERLQWLSRERFVLRSFNPAVYVALGDFDGAIRELRAASENHCPWFFQMLADPRLKPLQGQRDFEEMRGLIAGMESAAPKGMKPSNQPNI